MERNHLTKRAAAWLLLIVLTITSPLTAMAQWGFQPRKNVPTDSIRLSDPAVLADKATGMYYMTGTGGMMWRSADLQLWEGPFRVTEFDADSWMGPRPMIWAAELHRTGDDWYYYFATFTNQTVKIDTVRGNVIERRACQVLRADNPMGPYRAFGDATYLPADRPTLDGTFWRDTDGKPYMVFCGEWLQNWNGTVEKIELKPDFSGTVGEPRILFRASDSPWSRERDEQGNIIWNKVTDGPWLFRTGTGRLGMLWTSWVFGDYTQGVAYSESGTLDGPWVHEPEPITPPNYGHSMLFQRFDGQWMMSVHSHARDARAAPSASPTSSRWTSPATSWSCTRQNDERKALLHVAGRPVDDNVTGCARRSRMDLAHCGAGGWRGCHCKAWRQDREQTNQGRTLHRRSRGHTRRLPCRCHCEELSSQLP